MKLLRRNTSTFAQVVDAGVASFCPRAKEFSKLKREMFFPCYSRNSKVRLGHALICWPLSFVKKYLDFLP